MRLQLTFWLLSFAIACSATAASPHVPSKEDMKTLDPDVTARLKAYDIVFRKTSAAGSAAQSRYSNPVILADLEKRLKRAEKSGDYADVLTADERKRFTENSAKLKELETSYFEGKTLSRTMSAGVETQQFLTRGLSAEPKGARRAELLIFWKTNLGKNPLYADWHLPSPNSELKWSEVFEKFTADPQFRADWIAKHPETLPKLKQMSSIRAWDDTSVRSVQVLNAGAKDEYWILNYDKSYDGPNRFREIVKGDFDALMKNEFSSTLVFNRLTKIEEATVDGKKADLYNLVPVKKGRTMEPANRFSPSGSDKQSYPGASFLRKTKIDEFQQRELLKGDLSLFIGPRAMSLHEAQMLNSKYPLLTKAVGQFGFSITGGLAQTTSNRTDGVDKQATKLAATLVDIIDFANTKDVGAWFRMNTQQVLRTIVGGVGAGGASGNFEPGRSKELNPVANTENSCGRFGGIRNALSKLLRR